MIMDKKNLLTLVLNLGNGRKERLKILGSEGFPIEGSYLNLVEKVSGEEITTKYVVKKIEYTTTSFKVDGAFRLARCDVYLKKIE